jgi:hypothetical protein
MVSKLERGWAGHFCSSQHCLFRRNTLLDGRIVVSTVGNYRDPLTHKIDRIGTTRYHETMCFYSDRTDTEYFDADVQREIPIGCQCTLGEVESDNVINDMHEAVVAEIIQRIESGEL